MSTFNRIDHYLRLLELDGTHLVEQCEEYGKRIGASQLKNIEGEKVLAALQELTAKFRLQTTKIARLKAIEALADTVQQLIQSGALATRTLPDDALLMYRDPSGRKCDQCRLPEAKHDIGNQQLCAKCLVKLVEHEAE